MNQKLLTALVEHRAFATDTIITANYETLDLFGRVFHRVGNFKIHRILKNQDTMIFELISLADTGNSVIKANIEQIKAVDGMDLFRFADIYDLHPDGSKKKVGRKRGRKPKSQLTA